MKVIKKLAIFILIVILGVSIYFGVKGFSMYNDAISEKSLKEKVLEIESKENYTKIDEIPQTYINAVISVEDHRFYNHGGIDIIAIARATINDIKEKSFVEGGSTITQQLAKNIYFTQEKRIERKVAEVFMAFDLEKNYKKDKILELYINTSYLGDNCYTLKEASKHYFNKEPKEMTDYECIMIAGVPNAPSVYAPTVNLKLAKARQRQVASKMVENGYLTQDEMDKILESE